VQEPCPCSRFPTRVRAPIDAIALRQLATIGEALQESAEEVFEQWTADLEAFTVASLRQRSRTRLNQTKERYEAVLKAVQDAHEAFEVYNLGLRDHATFLGNDFNAASVAEIRMEVQALTQWANDVESLLVGELKAEEIETFLGVADVRATFRAPRFGLVAGCYVTEGEIQRNARARLVRDGVVVYDGRIASLRRFKDDVQAVQAGFECGIGLENFRDIKEGDTIESYEIREVART